MKLADLSTDGHERLVRVADPATGLLGYIAIHSTRRGPAAGGLRFYPYPDEDAAITDVLRLSRGMTFKNAAAGLPFGGGKSVIIGDPNTAKTPELLRAMGRAVDSLKGDYYVAEDMGVSPADMEEIARETAYVAGKASGSHASGDPSPLTAEGVFNAIRVTLKHATGDGNLRNRRIALQGLGHVGLHLGRSLLAGGARLIVADMDEARVAEFATNPNVSPVHPEMIYDVEADLFAPNAVGAILNEATIPRLRVKAVAGSANNQLATDDDGRRLADRGILYAPDYLANAGGVINVAAEILHLPNRREWVAARLVAMEQLLDDVLSEAVATGELPGVIADRIVGSRLLDDAA